MLCALRQAKRVHLYNLRHKFEHVYFFCFSPQPGRKFWTLFFSMNFARRPPCGQNISRNVVLKFHHERRGSFRSASAEFKSFSADPSSPRPATAGPGPTHAVKKTLAAIALKKKAPPKARPWTPKAYAKLSMIRHAH